MKCPHQRTALSIIKHLEKGGGGVRGGGGGGGGDVNLEPAIKDARVPARQVPYMVLQGCSKDSTPFPAFDGTKYAGSNLCAPSVYSPGLPEGLPRRV